MLDKLLTLLILLAAATNVGAAPVDDAARGLSTTSNTVGSPYTSVCSLHLTVKEVCVPSKSSSQPEWYMGLRSVKDEDGYEVYSRYDPEVFPKPGNFYEEVLKGWLWIHYEDIAFFQYAKGIPGNDPPNAWSEKEDWDNGCRVGAWTAGMECGNDYPGNSGTRYKDMDCQFKC